MLTVPDYQSWACHSTQESSREAQQKKLYKYIPPEFKPDSGRYREGKTRRWFTRRGAGSRRMCCRSPVTRAGRASVTFKFYGMDPRSLRGAEINDGWMDEESSIEWLDELIARATTRNGIVYLTFQAGNGVTPLVSIDRRRGAHGQGSAGDFTAAAEGRGENVQRPTSNVQRRISEGAER
jgi:hypothetical protein